MTEEDTFNALRRIGFKDALREVFPTWGYDFEPERVAHLKQTIERGLFQTSLFAIHRDKLHELLWTEEDLLKEVDRRYELTGEIKRIHDKSLLNAVPLLRERAAIQAAPSKRP